MNIGVGDTEMAALRLPSDILEGHLKGDGHPYSPGQGRESEERQHLLLDVDMDHLITKVIFDIIHAHRLYKTNISFQSDIYALICSLSILRKEDTFTSSSSTSF